MFSCIRPKLGPSLRRGSGGSDTHSAASTAIIARWARGSRIVNSVNSPTRLSTSIVPPCCWLTMSQLIERPRPVPPRAELDLVDKLLNPLCHRVGLLLLHADESPFVLLIGEPEIERS
jgi:hypothetical protein